MASLMQWLGEPWSGELSFEYGWRPLGIPDAPTRLHVLAALVRMGGWRSFGYGVTSGGGLYGRTGLQQNEAFVLWDLRSFVEGILYATDGAEADAFTKAMEAEWARVEALGQSQEIAN